MSINRRNVFALGGLGAVGAGTGALGAELDTFGGGLTIRILRRNEGWAVIVPDFDASWRPGQIAATKAMPVTEFLAELDKMDDR